MSRTYEDKLAQDMLGTSVKRSNSLDRITSHRKSVAILSWVFQFTTEVSCKTFDFVIMKLHVTFEWCIQLCIHCAMFCYRVFNIRQGDGGILWICAKIHNPYPNLTKASELLYPFPIHPIDILTRVEVYHKFKEHIIGCVIACPNLCCFNLLTTNTPVFRRWSVLQLHLLCFSTDTQVCFSTFAKIKANSLLSAQILELSS